MSLSKQLYIIISLIFFMIFAGNFVISVNNTKEYLQTESTTKAQDTATSLGMTLKSYIKDKQDPEIVSIINAIANRGFYKEIRLEDVTLGFTTEEILQNTTVNLEGDFEIVDIIVDSNIGEIEKLESMDELTEQLAALENETSEIEEIIPTNNISYNFIPGKDFIDGKQIELSLKVMQNEQIKTISSSIKLSKTLVKVSRPEKFDYIPQWFIDAIPLKMAEMKSEISDGWNISAVIYVSANAGDAYAKLYNQAKGAIIYAIVAFSISIIFLIIFLQFILKPLRAIETLASAIAKGHFQTITKLPWTTELKNVSIAMNDMSSKIEGVIKKLNNNLENMTKKLSVDGLTGLQLKSTFLTDIKMMFISKIQGYVFIVKIDDLGSYAKTHTNKEVDQFLIDFADIFKTLSPKAKAYRFFGSEFAMIIQNASEEETKEILEKLKKELEELGIKNNNSEIAHIGGTPFNFLGTTDSIVSASLEAYEKAKQIGPNEYFLRDEDDLARDMEEWKNLIFTIIDDKKFNVGFIGQAYGLCSKTKDTLFMEEAFTEAKDNDGNNIPIGTFISIAEQYEKILDFDKAVINKVIKNMVSDGVQHSVSINLSLDSVFDEGFQNWLKALILNNSAIASQLVFSVTAYGAAKNIDKFKEFIKVIHSGGAKVIIKRFETKFIPLDTIKDFNLDYIRLARDYTDGIAKDSTKEGFVESMQELCNLLNIKLFAENVKDDKDFLIVERLKLFGASR